MPASYPSSAKVFTTKSDGPGNTILAAHINDLQLEVTAVEQDLLAGLPVARGGTGLTSLTANRIPYGNGSGALQSGAGLTFDGATFTTLALAATTGVFSGALTPQALLDISGVAAGQLKFPAAQNASTNVNTLDDYEEGTFTPTDASGAALVFAAASGWYVKIGKLVVAIMQVTYPVTADGSNASIGSLPFTSGTGERWHGVISQTDVAASLTVLGSAAATQVNLWDTSANAKTNGNVSGKSFFIVACCRAAT